MHLWLRGKDLNNALSQLRVTRTLGLDLMKVGDLAFELAG